MSQKPPRKTKTHINVCVPIEGHGKVQSFLQDDSFGGSISRFYHQAAMKELTRLLQERNPVLKLSGIKLLECGWKKEGSSAYKRGDTVIYYDGVSWYLNDVILTAENYNEEILINRK